MKYLLLAILNFTVCICQAQKNFKKGHIVNNDGEIISGYINYREKIKSPVSVEFKKNKDERSSIYTVRDLKSFEITGFESYARYSCKVSMDYRDLNNLARGNDTAYKTDTLFMRVLETGKYVDMLSYQDKIKIRFYIKAISDSIPQELVCKAYLDPNKNLDVVVEVNDFRYQLMQYAEQHKAANDAFNTKAVAANYNRDDLRKLVRLINGNSEGNTMQNNPPAGSKKWFRFIAGAGVSRSSIRYSGIATNNDRFSFPDSYSPLISSGFDVIFKPAIGRFLVRQEFSYYKAAYKGTPASDRPSSVYIHSYNFRQQLFYSTTSLLYNFYNKNNYKLFLAGGINVYLMGYPENRHYITAFNQTNETTPMYFRKSFVGASVRAGATLANHLSVSYIYETPLSMTLYTQFDYKLSSHQLRFNYLF